jgi:hypothetical protein
MSMRTLIPTGWLMVGLGVVLGVGGIVAGQPLTGVILLISLVGSGAFMVWLARGWDTPLDDASELYKYGRPANAKVLKVEESQLAADGVRTAKVTLDVSPVNESSYRTSQKVALPGGREPVVGSEVTIKFDPNSRKSFVLLDESFEVKDQITATAESLYGGLPQSR